MTQQPETRFRLRVVEPALKELPRAYWVKIQAGSIRGIPDVLGCVNGRMVAMELKTDDGVLEPLQEYRLQKFREAGAFTAVARPSNWNDVIANLWAL